ncbi:uncharacterized protein LOC116129142 [Pistacia vera]|uniref:uncharacterized protein LOC116129142 n=1 Tax=Pistacia vera TaxID=55513 RepID=UPI001263C71D|nr:uncharacterized protein LOC116129142 [Pistacia vera]
MDLAYGFFSSTDTSFCSLPDPTVKIKHFTDFRRSVMLKGFKKCCLKRTGKIVDLPSAAKLRRSGVKFKRSEEKFLLNIRFENRLFPWLNCGGAELKIPNLVLYENTEKLLLNVMALEQCVYPDDALVSSYIDLINSLINTRKDVDLLVDEEIISSFLGDFASVANMFNRLSLEIRKRDSSYYGICEDLKKHYKNRCNHTMEAFIRWFFDPLKAFGPYSAGA